MSALGQLTLATIAFVLTHFVPSTPLRSWIISKTGERFYTALYVLVAFITLGWMIVAYRQAPNIPLWEGWRLLPLFLMPISLILVVAGLSTPNPTAVKQESRLRATDPARGILRVTRHPLMWAIALWAFAHIMARGEGSALVFFGGLLLLALLGTVLIDRRRSALGESWKRFAARTSNLPFVAIVQGRNRFLLSEIGWRRLAIGLALYGLLLWAHPYLFNTRPY